jgi:hypothetical protein
MDKVAEQVLSQNKAMELANLISLACEKNKSCMESYSYGTEEPTTLFSETLTCNESPLFDETCPNHTQVSMK